ncbi:NAD(P)-binding protein [Aspergillus steynii IBT 23096]|uniref:NAD(P)-binding protein n=1 Tax=Aspergillus steynii IBT 23096 TaxID=1392250 RepID=A0A2I2G6L8_9EURO|nr:NAD(P)-binding protein [Aspergillus steynii IBT 23096]PLB48522.1 NAD(P)-binding protein [Aspergillus steynii IBT 23096]
MVNIWTQRMNMSFFNKIASITGKTVLALALYKTWRFISLHLVLYGDRNLDRYKSKTQESWALVTGASAGIGYAYAEELVSRGFGVILLGHKPDELQQAESKLKSMPGQPKIKLITLDAITATPAEIDSALDPVKEMHLSILINNVGGVTAQPSFKSFVEYSATEIEAIINLNARFMAHVTHILLPSLKRNGPSLVLNMSSGSHMGMPWLCMYSAVKGFNASISRAISREAKALGMAIDSIVVYPGDVQSQANTHGLAPLSPTASHYAKVTLDRVVTAVRQGRNELNPFFLHGLSGLLDFVPETLFQKLVEGSIAEKVRVYGELAEKTR